MRIKLGKLFWFDVALASLLPLLAWYTYDDLTHGRTYAATASACAFLFNLWGSRRLFDFGISVFCAWWMARKVKAAIKFVEKIKETSGYEKRN